MIATVHDLKCSICDHFLLATPAGWVCSHCGDEIPYDETEIPKKLDTPMPGIRNGRDGRYCDACGIKMNKHSPRYCPGCGWDLWTRATERRI
jgi:predicted RNA-binding Zn-ribbon protein involved in translation (DUF1610 family)